MIKTVIFDFFGVLRTDGYKSWIINQKILDTSAYYDLSRRSDLALLNDDEFFDELSALVGRRMTHGEIDSATTIYKDVVSIAERVQENYQVGLLSNAPGDFLRGILKDNDLERLFNTIVISSEVGMAKPDRNIFDYTLDALDAQPHETIFIDDTLINVESANKLGINAIHFQNAEQLKQELAALGVNV